LTSKPEKPKGFLQANEMRLSPKRSIAFLVLALFSFEQITFAAPSDFRLYNYAPFGGSGESARMNTFETQFDSFGNASVMIACEGMSSRLKGGIRTFLYRQPGEILKEVQKDGGRVASP
jgi:hypothetical protein